MKIDVWADIVCPWCYLGVRRLTQALRDFPARDQVAVVYHPYQLDPAAPAAATPLTRYLERRFGPAAPTMMQRVTPVAAAEGIRIHWDRAIMSNTLAAHRLLHLARSEHGAATQRLLLDQLFDAHFTGGLDVGDHDTLARLAATAGLAEARVRACLAGSEGLADVQREMAVARQIGVQAVPTFVFDDRYAIQGAQPADVFRAALREAERQARQRPPA
jgi:predicted DsbA family dithiol-disulfide isomerase